MERHAPAGYQCPFCALVAGRETELNAVSDIVLRSERTTAFVSPKWWASSPGHVLVVPNEHYEHLYEISDDALAAVYVTVATIARAMRTAYDCEGVSTRQHNEPGAGQDVWHFHVHVFPRYADDRLYLNDGSKRLTTPSERLPFAERLRDSL